MLRATETLTRAGVPYIGPGAAVLQLCYDKLAASERVAAAGIDCPAVATSFPMIVKPRRGSDSIGVRLAGSGPIPTDHLAQEHVRGMEVTVAYVAGTVGAPLHIALPEGALYSFVRKYFWRPRHEIVRGALAERVRGTALKIAQLLGVDWAARVDFIYERSRDRLCFLECDVAPLIGEGSAFADSLAAGGVARAEQLRLILGGCS
ncbi:MAG TPA: ATP-grasp domain-containing protein [Burkholderiales bacterium]|jgi:D-alanine-D-alanine ligase-like ATP-grasp enzyme